MKTVLLLHLASTWFMVGVIWLVQVVHYPLFVRADRGDFVQFAAEHQRWTTAVVLPPMLIELLTAMVLAWHRPPAIPASWAWLGLLLLAIIWLSTFFLQVPQHQVLAGGFDAEAQRWLVQSNWLRTAVWSARGMLTLAMVWRLLAFQ